MLGWQPLAEIPFCFMQIVFLSENCELHVLSLGAWHNFTEFHHRQKLDPNYYCSPFALVPSLYFLSEVKSVCCNFFFFKLMLTA